MTGYWPSRELKERRIRNDKGWEAVAFRIDCGTGSFDKAGAQTVRTFGTPYLIVDLETIPTLLPAARISLDMTVGIRKL